MSELLPFQSKISREERQQLMRQRPQLLWFTGLSGSGKSTLAGQFEVELFENGFKTCLLDGDNIRKGLSKDLLFTVDDRAENIRRAGEISKLLLDAGMIVLCAFISPFRADREGVRQVVGDECYLEVFLDCPLDICEQRDVKGLYRKARSGQVKDFTGIDSPYEHPVAPALTIRTDLLTVGESLKVLRDFVADKIKL